MVTVRDAIEHRSLDDFADLLADDVVWVGRYPGELCRNRDDVLERFVRMRERDVQARPRIVLEKEDALVVDPGMDGRHHVIVVRGDGRVTEIRTYADRESALAAIEDRPW